MRVVLNNRVCSPPRLISFLRVPLVADPPSYPHARVVACHNVFRWRTRPDRPGVPFNIFSFRLMLISELRRRF